MSHYWSLILLFVVIVESVPNILFFVIDDLGWTDISHNGAEYETPNIDALYSNGVELSNYYVHPDCSPTRAAFLTGKYAWKTGLQNLGTVPPGTIQHIPFNTPTLAEFMQMAGYSTYGIGKWHLGYAAWNMTPIERGFDSYFGYFQGEQFYYNHTMEMPGYVPNYLNGGFDFWKDKNVYWDAIGNYSTDLYRNATIEILEKYANSNSNKNEKSNVSKDSKPFFIYLAFQTVHQPIEKPPKSYDTCLKNTENVNGMRRQTYCNKVVYLDETIGVLISKLKELNLYDNTLIGFTTDNGGMPHWLNGTSQYIMAVSWGCNWPFRGGKATLFEGGIKGIGLLSNEKLIANDLIGTKQNMLTFATDWFATFVEGIAGANIQDFVNELNYTMDNDFDSIDMWSYLNSISSINNGISNGISNNDNNDNDGNWNRTIVYANIEDKNGTTFGTIIEIESNTNTVWKYITGNQMYTEYFYCNQSTWDNLTANTTENEWLFNLSSNPYEYESENLINKYRDKANQLNSMIDDILTSDEYVADQSRQTYKESMPMFHDGVWAPFLD